MKKAKKKKKKNYSDKQEYRKQTVMNSTDEASCMVLYRLFHELRSVRKESSKQFLEGSNFKEPVESSLDL